MILDNIFFASAIAQALMFFGYLLFTLTQINANFTGGHESIVDCAVIQKNIVSENSETVVSAAKTFHFSDYSYQKNIEIKDETIPVVYFSALIRFVIPDNSEQLQSEVSNTLFSRPPPVFS